MEHIRQLVARGVQMDCADYDSRTSLHLAAAEGRTEVVRFLLDQGVDSNPLDRWGTTPLDDASRHRKSAVVEILQRRNAPPSQS